MPIYNPEPRLFLNNKFTNCYFFVIDKAQRKTRSKTNPSSRDFIYYESHHIVPRSLGGEDSKTNLVLLTAYEHYLCHWLLTKMCIDKIHTRKMLFPLRCMTNRNRLFSLKNMAKLYEDSKADIAQIISDNNKGKLRSDNFKTDLSNRMSGENNFMYGKYHSSDTTKKMSEAKSGHKNPNFQKKFAEDHKSKIAHGNRDKNTYGFTNKLFEVVWPDGRREIIEDRRAFSKQHGFRAGSISTAAVTGKSYKGMKITYVNRA